MEKETDAKESAEDLPLSGVRVIDFSRLLPGPWCTQTLADLGADVIKIEQPRIGDYGRFNPPNYVSIGVYFNANNRNKRSIVLDLTKASDREVALRLIDSADIVVEAFRAGVTESLGIDYATLSVRNPSVIYCSVSGMGNDSRLGRVPGHDLGVQAVAGTLGKNVAQAGKPPMPTFQAGDFAAASYATIGILAAHVRRMRTGKGCYLEIPMFDSLVSCSSVAMTSSLARLAGATGEPAMEPWGTNPRYRTYRTRDGKMVAVCLLEMRTWHLFCRHIGREDLIYDEAWEDRHTAHGERAGTFEKAISEFCLAHDRDEIAEAMCRAGISITPVYTPDEALHSDHATERGIVRFSDHPRDGKLPYFYDPLMRAGLSDPTRRPAPDLGQHSAEVRAEADSASPKQRKDSVLHKG